jgi:hypothetical protein
LEPVGGVDGVEGEGEGAEAEKLVDGEAAAGPGAVVVERNETTGDDGIVEGIETEFYGFVPVGVNIQEGDLRDADGREGVLEKAGNDAHAREVGASASEKSLDATGAGDEIADPSGGLRAVGGGRGRHALEGVEEPNGAREGGVRGGTGQNGGGAALVDAAFEDVTGDVLVLDALSEARKVADALGTDHGVAANETGDALLGEAGLQILQEAHGRAVPVGDKDFTPRPGRGRRRMERSEDPPSKNKGGAATRERAQPLR